MLRRVAARSRSIPNGGYADNRFYFGVASFESSGAAVTTNSLYCYPFVVGASWSPNRIGIDITTGAADSSGRLGIYRWANGAPTTLVLDAGEVATADTGTAEATIAVNLAPGIYGVAAVFDDTPSVRMNFANVGLVRTYVHAFVGNTAFDTSAFNSVRVPHTYGALPASFGTPTYIVNTAPCVSLRRVA